MQRHRAQNGFKNALDSPLARGVLYDGGLVEQYDGRRRQLLGLPLKNDTLRLGIVHDPSQSAVWGWSSWTSPMRTSNGSVRWPRWDTANSGPHQPPHARHYAQPLPEPRTS